MEKMTGYLSHFEEEIVNLIYRLILENKFEGGTKKSRPKAALKDYYNLTQCNNLPSCLT